MRTMLRGKVTLLFMTLGLVLAIPAIALADNLQDSITAGSNAKTIATGTANGFENKYWVEATGSGGVGCDIPVGGNVKFKLNVPTGVTASTTDLTFTQCGTSTTNTVPVTFSSDNPGVYDITASYVSETDSAGVTTTTAASDTYNENPANLKLTVFGVSSVTPADGATGVAANTNVTATFPVDPTGLSNTTFKLVKDGTTTSVPAVVSYASASKTATLNPNADLELGTKYNATISGLTFDGVTLVDKTWSFTTVAPACTNPADPVFQNTTPDGDNGWFVNTPTVSATSSTSGAVVKYSDAAGGTYSTTAPTLGEGTTTVFAKAFSSTGTCSSAAVSHTYKVDTIDPEVNPADVVNSTWRNTDLSQAFTASDNVNGSGLANSADANFTLTASAESADADTPTVVSKTVFDLAGNSTTRSVSAKIDLTDPVISGADINDTTWRNTDLSANFTSSDALSGLAPNQNLGTNGSFTLTTSGESTNATTPVTASKTVNDNAGNSDTRTISALVDKTAPNVQVTGVSNNGSYTTGNVPTPGCTTTDGLSDVKTNATVNVTGGTGGFGTLTATCSGAEDNAGNTKPPVSVTYTVSAAFNGWLQPVDGDGSTNGTLNIGKVGRTYPIKWQLKDSSGALLSDTTAQLLVGTMSGGQVKKDCGSFSVSDADTLEESLTGNTSLRYDATSDQFIYNYKAPSTLGCYAFAIKNADGATIKQANFDFRK